MAKLGQLLDAVRVFRGVKAFDFGACRGSRLSEQRLLVEALLERFFPECILAIRSERVAVRKSVLAERCPTYSATSLSM